MESMPNLTFMCMYRISVVSMFEASKSTALAHALNLCGVTALGADGGGLNGREFHVNLGTQNNIIPTTSTSTTTTTTVTYTTYYCYYY